MGQILNRGHHVGDFCFRRQKLPRRAVVTDHTSELVQKLRARLLHHARDRVLFVQALQLRA